MRGWALGERARGIRRRPAESSEVEVVGDGLVELEVWDGLGLDRVEGGRLIEEPREEIALGRSASGSEGWGFVGEVEVEEDGGDDGRIGQKSEDPHFGAAGGTQEGQHVVDTREQDGPTEGHDVRPQPGIRSQNPVVAVTMNVRGRDELREGFEELEEREQQLSAAVGVAFGETVEKAALGRRKGGRGVEGVQSFEREGRAGTVADETPDARPARTSIVDLLKLLEIDSSYAARKALATELGCPADLMRDSARMNMWLHKTVLARVAANGGNVPHSLLD